MNIRGIKPGFTEAAFSILDFGGKGDGVTDDAVAFTAAIASIPTGGHGNITVPRGTYLLNSSPTISGKTVAWIFEDNATFTGTGTPPGTIIYLGGGNPTNTTLKTWKVDLSNSDNAAPLRLAQTIPSTASMAGGGAVEGIGVFFQGSTSAATPNSGFAETNMIRMDYTVNSAAGNKVQIHMINGLLTVAADEGGSGVEHAGMIHTTRVTGPTSGTAAIGAWGLDIHVEKAGSVLDGKMVGLEVGIHKQPALGSAKCRGIDLWSGDRSGYTATRAGDALYIQGGAGWTNFLKFMHTDSATEVWKLDATGNLTTISPSGDQTLLFQTAANTTSVTGQFVGKTGGGTQVSGVIQAASGGQVVIGSTSNHPLQIRTNGTNRITITAAGNISATAGTTSMTDGFFYIPAAAGAPSGAATAVSGAIPLYYDTTNNFLYVYNGGWKKSTVYA